MRMLGVDQCATCPAIDGNPCLPCCAPNKANHEEFAKRKAKALAIAKRAASNPQEPADSARTKNAAVKKVWKKPAA